MNAATAKLNALRNWHAGLQPRERRLVTAGASLAVILLLVAVLLPLQRSVSATRTRIEHKRVDLAWMQQVSPVLAGAGPAASVPASQESLLIVVDRAAREAGLSNMLTGSQPSGKGGLRVQMEKAPFDLLIAWLARLSEQNGVRVVTATMDAAGEPGMVNAGIVLQTR